MSTAAIALRMASTARWSAATLLPRPCSGAAAFSIHVNARSLEDCGDAHAHPVERGVESVDQDLVLVELDLAEPPWTGRADFVRPHQLRPYRSRRPRFDRQPRRPGPGKTDGRLRPWRRSLVGRDSLARSRGLRLRRPGGHPSGPGLRLPGGWPWFPAP